MADIQASCWDLGMPMEIASPSPSAEKSHTEGEHPFPAPIQATAFCEKHYLTRPPFL